MRLKGLAAVSASFAWTFGALYGVESLADYLYFQGNPAFFTVSGLRLELFIAVTIMGPLAAGALLKGFQKTIVSQVGALGLFLAFAYWLCDPRVCFSTGPDGLEPARLGLLLGSCVVVGSSGGARVSGVHGAKGIRTLTSSASLIAVAFFPVLFFLAGTRLLWTDGPIAAASVVALAGVYCGHEGALDLGKRKGFVAALAGLGLLLVTSEGIAADYLPSVLPGEVAIVGAGAAGALVGAFWLGPVLGAKAEPVARMLMVAGLILVLAMNLVVLPDAVAATSPGGKIAKFPPSYVGAYMDGPPGHSDGVGVNVSFSGTDPAAVQPGNYLAGGIGIHGAGCCVDGIDYAYRSDAYLFHNGTVWLSATAWEVCDDNVACGGHSWKTLLFSKLGELDGTGKKTWVLLTMTWEETSQGPSVVWREGDGRTLSDFATFHVPSVENRDFNTGVLVGGTFSWEQSASYFLQFGVSSAYPITSNQWKVTFTCPEILTSTWACISHARAVQGSDSFWKVIWRWGEDYPGVGFATEDSSVTFSYSGSTTNTGAMIW